MRPSRRQGLKLTHVALMTLVLAGLCACAPVQGQTVATTPQDRASCTAVASRLAACSSGSQQPLHVNPNDAVWCAELLAEHDNDCHLAYENFAACATGTPCKALHNGACLADYSAVAGFCGGMLSANAMQIIGRTTR